MNKVKRGYYEVLLKEICTSPEKTSKGEITSIYLRKMEEKINEQPQYWLDTQKMETHKIKTACSNIKLERKTLVR